MNDRRAQVLAALAESTVSGPALADELDISRTAVWKHVEGLREEGFDIESTNAGYELVSVPEFGAATLQYDFSTPYEIEFHETIDSTNERARTLADDGAEDIVVIADEQTGGRGRLDREWVSPSGGIWLSVLLRPDCPPHHAPAYTLAAAVATTRAIRDLGVDATIKWPNDVLVDDRKVTGILTEMEGEADRISWLVVGIGINANVDPDSLPGDRPATSLRAESGNVNRRALTQDLLAEFHQLTADLDTVVPAWRELSSTLGEAVRVETPSETIEGEAVDIEFPGSLIVDTGDDQRTITAGDCEHLRADA